MYLPYIRAKQHDLNAIVSLSNTIYNNNAVIPIIEPVARSISTTQYRALSNNNIPFILVVNPTVGTFKSVTPDATIVNTLVNNIFRGYDDYTLGFIIQPNTTLAHVRQFIAAYPSHKHAYIHFSQFANAPQLAAIIDADANKEYNIFIERRTSIDYINEFTDNGTTDVLIRDGFIKQVRNEDYPDEDFFYNLHRTYTGMGYDGFGDFTVIGEQFQEGGGPAYVVTLHLTDLDERNDFVVRHFKSEITPNMTPANPGGKFRYALTEMNRHLRANPTLASDGITEYKTLHRTGHYPGLGIPKKLSIMHHIEMVHSQI